VIVTYNRLNIVNNSFDFTKKSKRFGMHKDEITSLKKEIVRLKSAVKKQKYGLHWLDISEAFQEDAENRLPTLKEIPDLAVKSDDGQPTHILIEGDNYHSLTCLNYTHKNKIDVIYIDPPYNTGSDGFRYKDKRIIDKFPDGTEVPNDHPFRHSYWLSFMKKRMELAKNLLTDEGVIFISIGEDEIAQLKLLCNEIFGEKNFIANFIWEKTQHFGRQKLNSYSNADYILAYGKQLLSSGLKELLVEKIKEEHEDAPLYNASNRVNSLTFPKNTVVFNIPNKEYSCTTDEKYKLLEKVTVKKGKNYNDLVLQFKSRWSQATVDREILKGTTFWVKSEKFSIRAIYGSGKTSKESPKQIIFTNSKNEYCAHSRFDLKVGTNEEGSRELKNIIGIQEVFQYPKPKSLIQYLISLIYDRTNETHRKRMIVLDFFAGSGTTGHAVLGLNEQENSDLQFILCTNNENNICSKVCYPRIKKVIKGYKSQNNEKINGLGNSLKYYKTDFIGKHSIQKVTDEDRIALAQNAGELLAIAEDTLYEVSKNAYIQFFTNNDRYTAVYFREDLSRFGDFVKKVRALEKPTTVYIFSWGSDEFGEEFEDLRNVKVKSIPQPILEMYKSIYEG